MHPYNGATQARREKTSAPPSDDLHVAVTFKRRDGGAGPTQFSPPLSVSTSQQFVPDPMDVDKAVYELHKLGFRLTQRGKLSVSMRVSRQIYEKTFGTKLEPVRLNAKEDYAFHSFYFPPDGARWSPSPAVSDAIDDVYIQWPHIYMSPVKAKRKSGKKTLKRQAFAALADNAFLANTAPLSGVSVTPPAVNYYHLEIPGDVPRLLNVPQVHHAGTTGKGVRVAMVDTGFAHQHPFFVAQGFKSTVDLAPHATNDQTDSNGHGTGESTNLFCVAPGVTFIGIKVDNDDDPQNGASMLEGFQQALQHQPQIISLSMGYDLRDAITGMQSSELPNSLAALEAEIQAAVAKGIVVVFSAGNGHFSFPGMMPDVISAGGVFVDKDASMRASDYASAFQSKIYPGRSVPDFCGLVGMLPHASYIMLPIPPGSEIDRETAQPSDPPGDGTTPDDGWGVFSGTSAAAPQLAGVCALLLEKNPGLTPSDIKAILRRSARSVTVGSANPASSDNGVGEPASAGDNGAAGAGLIDAFAAWQQA